MIPTPAPASYPSGSSAFTPSPLQSGPGWTPFMQSNQTGFPQTGLANQNLDPNSPDTFKHNIQIAQQHLARIHTQAVSILAGTDSVYHFGKNPSQTEAEISTLKENLQVFSEFMRSSGVGALPLLPKPKSESDVAPVMTEEMMLADTTKSVKVLYEKLERSQESAAVVANLLNAPDHKLGAGAGR